MAQTLEAGMVFHPVDDFAAAVAFYENALGLSLQFKDGERFAVFDAGGTRIALAAGEERVADGVAVSYKVDDVDAMIAELSEAGAEIVSQAADGPHERRAVLRDPAGNALVVYASLS